MNRSRGFLPTGVVCLALALLLVAAPTAVAERPATPVAGQRYVDKVFSAVDRATDIEFATASSLVDGSAEVLRLDTYQPTGDLLGTRPAIVFVHGGGFRGGDKQGLADDATAWAERGYVTVSVDYRLDPTNRCQEYQDGKFTDPTEADYWRQRCATDIAAAQHDVQAAIRWLRATAVSLRVDRQRIGAIGFSAGAVTVANLAYRSQDPGQVGDHPDQDSRVQAAVAASGCEYQPSDIGAGDAPMFFLHAEYDQAVPFDCAVSNAAAARAAGLAVDTLFYYGEGEHARVLYHAKQAEVDPRWERFLYTYLDLGSLAAGQPVPAGSFTLLHGEPYRTGLISLTMTQNTAPGWLQVLACGDGPGGSSNVNADAPDQIRTGQGVVHFDARGEACIYNSSATHLVADLQGYLAPGAIDDVADERLLDTRLDNGPPLPAGADAAIHGRPNSTAVVSLVMTDTTGPGWVQALPCGAASGGTSNVNADRAGQTVQNLAFVRFAADGTACLHTYAATHLVVDLQAYLAAGAFEGQPGSRLLDTRGGELPAGGSQTPVALSPGAIAVMSVVATETAAPGWVQALPCGAKAGSTSNVTIDAAHETVAGVAVVSAGTDGTCFAVYAPTHLVADLQGYFVTGMFDDVVDVRLLDTRP